MIMCPLQHKKARTMALNGKRLRQLREAQGMTQYQVGEAIGRKEQAVGRYESGKAEPSAEIVLALAKLLGTNSPYLLGEWDYNGPITKAIGDAAAAIHRGDVKALSEIAADLLRQELENRGDIPRP